MDVGDARELLQWKAIALREEEGDRSDDLERRSLFCLLPPLRFLISALNLVLIPYFC